MIELRKILEQELLSIHPRVAYQRNIKEDFPYVLYDLPNSFVQDDQEIFNLDIDIWDNHDDTTEIETIASNVWRRLNKYHYIDDNIQFSIYRENRLPPMDDKERSIKRRKLIFQLRYFDRRI